ncbi:hypothetical protein Cadr_000007854 [Camelus dromedarius]|uniref:Uncharacterized protein n=1 Tax=Camelus dromedarius TaxID=9838 RepID=A0A5N4E074_CAMDR|nr:hypothetical protein Cadr_000007854 [Camelus dromedarius]
MLAPGSLGLKGAKAPYGFGRGRVASASGISLRLCCQHSPEGQEGMRVEPANKHARARTEGIRSKAEPEERSGQQLALSLRSRVSDRMEPGIDLGHLSTASAPGAESAGGCDNCNVLMRSGLSRAAKTEIRDLWIKQCQPGHCHTSRRPWCSQPQPRCKIVRWDSHGLSVWLSPWWGCEWCLLPAASTHCPIT